MFYFFIHNLNQCKATLCIFNFLCQTNCKRLSLKKIEKIKVFNCQFMIKLSFLLLFQLRLDFEYCFPLRILLLQYFYLFINNQPIFAVTKKTAQLESIQKAFVIFVTFFLKLWLLSQFRLF